MIFFQSKKKRAIVKQHSQQAAAQKAAVPKRRTSSYAFSHSEGFGSMIKKGSYLEDPNEFTSSRVHVGGRNRSASRFLPTHAEVEVEVEDEKDREWTMIWMDDLII